MSRLVVVHDRDRIAAFLRQHPATHLYALGDLDDFFFPRTSWLGLEDARGELTQILLVYAADGMPVVHALTPDDPADLRALVRAAQPRLAPCFYLHASPGIAEVLLEHHTLEPHGLHHRMVLRGPSRGSTEGADVAPLGPAQRAEVEAFYAQAYPDNWFDPRMLETGAYVAARLDGGIVAIAGVHVLSRAYRVAALGNVATSPRHRGRGLGRVVVSALCRELAACCDVIGLNVAADNAAAIRLYERLGFAIVGSYEEHLVRRRT